MFVIFKKLWWFFRKNKLRYFTAICSLLIASLITIIPPKLFGDFIDDIFTTGTLDSDKLRFYIIAFSVIIIAGFIFGFIWTYLMFGGGNKLEYMSKRRYYRKLIELDSEFYASIFTGIIIIGLIFTQIGYVIKKR